MKALVLEIAVILFGIALTVGLNPLGNGLIGVIVSALDLHLQLLDILEKKNNEPLV